MEHMYRREINITSLRVFFINKHTQTHMEPIIHFVFSTEETCFELNTIPILSSRNTDVRNYFFDTVQQKMDRWCLIDCCLILFESLFQAHEDH